jgi:hypothetical protein
MKPERMKEIAEEHLLGANSLNFNAGDLCVVITQALAEEHEALIEKAEKEIRDKVASGDLTDTATPSIAKIWLKEQLEVKGE